MVSKPPRLGSGACFSVFCLLETQTPQDLKLQDGDIIHCTLAHEGQQPVASASDASAASVPAVVAANMAASTQSATAAATTVTLGGTDGDSDGDDLSEGAMDMDDSTQGPDAAGDAQQPHWFVAGGFRGLPRKSQLQKLHAVRGGCLECKEAKNLAGGKGKSNYCEALHQPFFFPPKKRKSGAAKRKSKKQRIDGTMVGQSVLV